MNLYSNERKTKECVEKYFSTILYKTDKYHPFDYRDSMKDYYVIYNKNISSKAHEDVYIEMNKIEIANISDKSVYFIFAYDDATFIYTHNRNSKCILQYAYTNELKNYCWVKIAKLERIDLSAVAISKSLMNVDEGDISPDDEC